MMPPMFSEPLKIAVGLTHRLRGQPQRPHRVVEEVQPGVDHMLVGHQDQDGADDQRREHGQNWVENSVTQPVCS